MARFWRTVALSSLLSTYVVADIPTCGPGSKCPADAPCCSQYGQCGVGAYCLGGCDPLFSHDFNSCVPNPACQSQDYKLSSLDDVAPIEKYLGDASKANWQSQGNPVVYNNGILLTMAEDTVGTLLASTHYVWYGKISAKLTTSQGAGVITAFIMMSDVKDEIDFEFVGVDIEHAQSNYYCQGILNYNNEMNLTASNTVENVHEYTIDWQPDSITWSIDGKEMRTVKRSDTWNATANRFDYPQTPSRIMLSLWPAGLSSNAKGTIEWGGGLVNWNSPYMQNGYYYAMVEEVNVQCYDPPSGANIKGKNSYIYTDAAGTNNTVEMTDNLVVLKSLYANGDNPGYDPNASASATKSGASQTPSSQPQQIPGQSGGGNRQEGGGQGGGDNGGSPSASGTQSGGASNPTQSSSNNGGGFNQGGGNKNGAESTLNGHHIGGSVFAVVVAVIGLMFL